MRLLLTSFSAFEGVAVNPSQVLLERFLSSSGGTAPRRLSAEGSENNLIAAVSNHDALPVEAATVLTVSEKGVIEGLRELLNSSGIDSKGLSAAVGGSEQSTAADGEEQVEASLASSKRKLNEVSILEAPCLNLSNDRIVCVHLGVNANGAEFQLEKFAYNKKTFKSPDVDGEQPNEIAIVDELPLDAALSTRLDLNLLCLTLSKLGHRVKVSTDPGRYLCNMCYFLSLFNAHCLPNCDVLFVHVPSFETIDLRKQSEFLHDLIVQLMAGQ